MPSKSFFKELLNGTQPSEAGSSDDPMPLSTSFGHSCFFSDLVENSRLPIVVKDSDGRYLMVNAQWEDVFGMNRDSVLNQTDETLFPMEVASMIQQNDAAVIETGKPGEREERLTSRTGRRDYIVNRQPLSGEDGLIVGLCCMMVDITDRNRLENAPTEKKPMFHSLLDNAQVALFRTSTDGRLLEINQRYAEMAGFDSIEMCMSEFTPGEAWVIAGAREKLVRELMAKGMVRDFETQVIRRDGSPIWILFSATLFSEQGVIEGSIIDITDRKQVEQSLRESEARFKALHNASFGGIAIHDKGIILECNQGLCGMFGYSMNELLGMDGLLLIAEKSRDMVMKNILSGYEKPYEAFGLHKSGKEFPMRLEARNVPYKGKNVRTVEFRDITENVRAEEERKKLQDQLTQAQKMESVGRLAGGVAHDYNNMLSVIIGYTELALENEGLSESLRSDLKEVLKAAHRSEDITRQLLAFARKQTIAPKVLDINKIVGGMLKMLKRLIGEDIDIVWIPMGELWSVNIDPSQVEQVLANLCVNARDAISGVGKVTIETHMVTLDEAYCVEHPGFIPGEFVLLTVSDDGCGIDRETIDFIFEPFFTTKDVNAGTGLGLATVYGIVKQNNGFINVYSEPEEGTTFKIYLPRHMEVVDRIEAEETMKTPVGDGELVLLVEDESAIRTLGQKMLEKIGYRVLIAATPAEAIDLVVRHQGKIDLLLTDVVMPEMNGRELMDKIHGHYPKIKTLFMSGYTANVIVHRGVLEEEVFFIQKPFTSVDLAKKVSEALEN